MRALEREKEQFSFHVAGSVRHSEPFAPLRVNSAKNLASRRALDPSLCLG